jgi:hypothetical protein
LYFLSKSSPTCATPPAHLIFSCHSWLRAEVPRPQTRGHYCRGPRSLADLHLVAECDTISAMSVPTAFFVFFLESLANRSLIFRNLFFNVIPISVMVWRFSFFPTHRFPLPWCLTVS